MIKVLVDLPVKCQLSCALTLAKISKCRQIRFKEIQPFEMLLVSRWMDM